jgi:hypothetical protein
MKNTKKNYLVAWGMVGVAFPILMLLLAKFAPLGEQAPRFVGLLLSPMIFVVYGLSLMVTDGGGDSGTLFWGTVIFTIAILLNAALYVGVGLASWPVAQRLLAWFRETPEKLTDRD